MIPYSECPSFLKCSCNKCPLDPDMSDKIRYPDEEKCKANKPTRVKIGEKYPNLLPYKGLTSREWHGKKRWEALTPAERTRIATAGLKALKSFQSGIAEGV